MSITQTQEVEVPLTILIVDDNKNNLFTLNSLIAEYLAVNVIQADSGNEALRVLMKTQVDLIILDVQMPEMDGFETAKIIRSRKKTQHIPIVFLTAAFKSEEFQDKGYALGAADYLTKPIDSHQLISRIQIYLRFICQEREHNAQRLELEAKIKAHNLELIESNNRLQQEVNERKRIEEALKWAKEAAETASTAKSQFLATMSHELRTPLNVIMGYTDILREDLNISGHDEYAVDLDRIYEASRSLLTLINDILDISKIEAGTLELHCEHTVLQNLLQDVLDSIPALMEKNANSFELIKPEECWQDLYVDVRKVQAILTNLLNNAAKFTESGTITLEVGCFEDDNNHRWVSFAVRDTGIGLSPEQIDKLFRPFVQVDSSYTRKYGGTGLGLAISKHFVEMMGGRISVDSDLGAGSTFTVQLPFEPIDNPTQAASATPATQAVAEKAIVL